MKSHGTQLHIPPKKLEVNSDDEEIVEFENEMSIKHIKNWSKSIKSDTGFEKNFKNMILSLQGALGSKDNDKYVENKTTFFNIKDGPMFNAVIRACLIEVEPAIESYLGIMDCTNDVKNLMESVKFKKMKAQFFCYLSNMIKLTSQLSQSSSLLAVLNHVKNILPLFLVFPKLIKLLRNLVINLWSSGEESVRVLAFIIIINMIKIKKGQKNNDDNLNYISLDLIMKKMHRSFVIHSKFTTISSLPLIMFMQKTLIEIFEIDLKLSYKFAFLNLKHQAVLLKNAYNTKQKENILVVYNWQYINTLSLWSQFIALHASSDKLIQSLVNPLVQICMGTIKLVPSARYTPIRFHLIKALTQLCNVGIYIPLIPFVTEIFDLIDFNKNQSVILNKQINMDTLLKITKIQMRERVYKDEVINRIYDALADYMVCYANNIAFPEITFLLRQQLKRFVKRCRNPTYKSSMKQLLTKVEENAGHIDKKRSAVEMSLTRTKEIEAFESVIKNEGTPFAKYHATWKKIRTQELISDITGRERISEYGHIPRLERRARETESVKNGKKLKNKSGGEAKVVKRRKPNELFEESADSDNDPELFKINTKELLSDTE